MPTDTFSPETREKYQGTSLWKPWMNEIRLRQITSISELGEFFEANAHAPIFSWDVETQSLLFTRENICGHCIAFSENEAVYVPVNHVNYPQQNLPPSQVYEMVMSAMVGKEVIAFNWMTEGRILKTSGFRIPCEPGKVADVMIYRWLYDPDSKQFNLKDSIKTFFPGVEMLDIDEVPGAKIGRKAKEIGFHFTDPQDATLYAAADPVWTYNLLKKIRPVVEKEQSFIVQMEHALVDQLLDMEDSPICIDRGYLAQAIKDLRHWEDIVDQKIYSNAGREFNVDSNAEVGKVLTAQGHVLPKTETGKDATGAEVLEVLAAQGVELASLVLLHRSLVKERTTYAEKLYNNTTAEKPFAVFKFKSVGAPTGRLASGGVDEGDPVFCPANVQSIPSASKYRPAKCHRVKPPKELIARG